MVKRLSTMRETRVRSLGREDPLEKEWQPTPVFLPGKFHGLRILVGYSPWGLKESDMTEQTSLSLSKEIQSTKETKIFDSLKVRGGVVVTR